MIDPVDAMTLRAAMQADTWDSTLLRLACDGALEPLKA